MRLTRLLLPALLTACCLEAAAAEFLFEDFDSSPTGTVSQIDGWGGSFSAFPLVLNAAINGEFSFSGNQHVRLYNPGGSAVGVRALYTNYYSAYSPATEHPVIQFSAWVHVDQSDLPWQIGIESSSDGLGVFAGCRASDGQLFITNEVSHTVHYTGHHVTTGAYVNLQLCYNRTNAEITCAYNGTNILNVWNSGGPARTTFDRLNIYRPSGSASGDIRIDDLSVITFPKATLAWWRMYAPGMVNTSPYRLVAPEATGLLRPGACVLSPGQQSAPWPGDPLFDGYHNVRSPRILPGFAVVGFTQVLSTGSISNWTVEAFVRIADTNTTRMIMEWGDGPVAGAGTNSMISLFIRPGNILAMTLRDKDVETTANDYYSNIGSFPGESNSHHLAFVKYGTNLTTYIDYRAVTTTSLRTRSARSYRFLSSQIASVGSGNNLSGMVQGNDFVHEVRVSTEALDARRFLYEGPPAIMTLPSSPGTGTSLLNVQTIPLFFYDVYGASSCTGPWQVLGSRTATGTITTIGVSTTNKAMLFLQGRREARPPP